MDPDVVKTLREAGVDTTLEKRVLSIALAANEDGGVIPDTDVVCAVDGKAVVMVTLKETSELFVGDRKPPDFSKGPTEEYMLFFLMIERAAADYCVCTSEKIRDEEFAQLYGDLRLRPDGRSDHPLHSHLRGAIRMYMSLRDVSRAEYEAVLRRLVRSAHTFAMGPTSMNYLERALIPLLGGRERPQRSHGQT